MADIMNIRLRSAVFADAKLYADVARKCMTAFPGIYAAAIEERAIISEIQTSNVFIIELLDRDGVKDVGFVSYRAEHDRVAYISELAVDPKFHGHKIGRDALIRVIGALSLMGFNCIRLHTHENGPGRLLYERLGFRICGCVTNFQGTGVPRIELRLDDLDIPELRD